MFEIKEHLENRGGKLYIGGCGAIELAKKYGTPLYVYDEQAIRKRYRTLVSTFSKYYKNFECYYAIKANNNLALLNVLRQEGAGADASCPEEIHLAKKAGFPQSKILYSGVYHTEEQLKTAIKEKIVINLEDITQIDRLMKYGRPEMLSLRINPGIGKGGSAKHVYGGPDAKFGIIEKYVLDAYKKAKQHGIKKFGIHMMTGSNILDSDYFKQVTEKLLDIAGAVHKQLGIDFEFVDIGGGFGVTYAPNEQKLDVENVAKTVCEIFKAKCSEHDLGNPTLKIEPGRYIVCESAILLVSVTSIKEGYKKFIGVDAGMNTLIRPMLYNAHHAIYVANNLNESSTENVNVVGPVCENIDQFAKDRMLPKCEVGDLLTILNAGAYGFAMSSQYNSRPRAAEVLVNNGKHELIRKREKVEDLYNKVVVPKRLRK